MNFSDLIIRFYIGLKQSNLNPSPRNVLPFHIFILLELLKKTLLKRQSTPVAQVYQARLVPQELLLGFALGPILKSLCVLAQRLAQKSIFELLHQFEALQLTNGLILTPTSQELRQELGQE